MPTFLTNLKYPFLTYSGVGFLIGVLAMSLTLYNKYVEVEEKREMIHTLQKELKTTTDRLMAEITKVTREKESLEKSKKKVTKPDGTVIEEENSKSNKESESIVTARLDVLRETQTEIVSDIKDIKESVSTRRKVTIGLGVDQRLDTYIYAHSLIWGPIGAGMTMSKDTYILGITIGW